MKIVNLKEIKENNSEYLKIIDDIENEIKNIKELLDKKIERNKNSKQRQRNSIFQNLKCKPEFEKQINDFIKILFNKKEKKDLCQRDINHGIATEFCTECLKWYCPTSSKEHSSYAFNHITIKSEENIELNSLCENENCQSKGKTEFYCQSCLKNLCRNCKNEHDKTHEIIIYEDFFKEENFIKFKNSVKEVSNWIKENNSEYLKIFGDIENVIKKIKELLEKKLKVIIIV